MVGSQLPGGTVTFLFTDIEGSTKLLHELGPQRYAEALDRHRQVVREYCRRHEGVEVDTQGDAFFVAFPTVPGALEAAREAQDALAIPVRMGIHTGTPLLTDEGYVGTDVHKAARIAASGHGRQILVSSASAALLGSDGLRDLGEHRLKDLSAPERIYQVGGDDYPPLKTLYRTNLPIPATPFLGRERELAELGEFLGRDDVRLLTLLGPGGTGKTRLALQAVARVAERYPDGVFWVPLAPLRDPGLVLESAAKAVEARDGLVDHLADKRLLLLLDNFEHLIAAASDLTPLLGTCPNLSLVVTSRELLQLAPEQSYPVPPLDPPDGVQLFVARAKAVKPAFEPDEALPALCERLDNLPLALELAAARVRILSPQQLHERLTQRLDLLKAGRDADPRQQTLRATIEWSYDLLDEDEQRLFARLAVFRGGCTLATAETVADADLDNVESLVDKSLLRHTDERFWMLETIRAFARERLATTGEEADLRQRHAVSALEFVEAVCRDMDKGGDQMVGLAQIDVEHDNLRAALEWARDSRADEVLLRLVAALASFWFRRGYYGEADSWLPLALERGSSPATARMDVLRGASIRAAALRDYDRSDAYVAEWRSLAELAGDEGELLRAMNSAALNASEQGDLDKARAELVAIGERAREIGDRRMVAFATINLGMVAWEGQDFPTAIEYSERAVELFRELDDLGGVASALGTCGWSSLALSDPEHAETPFREALVLAGGLAWKRGVAVYAAGLAATLVAGGKAEQAAQLYGAVASIHEELGILFDDAFQEQIHERAVAAAKAALGDDAFTAAWVRGETMTREEIVAFAEPEQSVRSPS